MEYLLYREGCLLKEDGAAPTEKEFIDRAFPNAAEEYAAYWRLHPELAATLTEDGRDRTFMNEAIGRAKREVDFLAVERIAAALLASGTLDEDALKAAIA